MGTLAFDLIFWPPLLTIVGTDLRLSSAQLLAKPYGRAGWGFPGCITRTPIYSHFNSVDEIYRQIAIRFVQQTGVDVERYVRRRKPTTLEELVTLMIKAIQNYSTSPIPPKPARWRGISLLNRAIWCRISIRLQRCHIILYGTPAGRSNRCGKKIRFVLWSSRRFSRQAFNATANHGSGGQANDGNCARFHSSRRSALWSVSERNRTGRQDYGRGQDPGRA